jgi:hypothetical protein
MSTEQPIRNIQSSVESTTRRVREALPIRGGMMSWLRGPGAKVPFLDVPYWKALVLNDCLVYAALGLFLIVRPEMSLRLTSMLTNVVSWPPVAWLSKSETVDVLIEAIGTVALAFVVPLIRCIYNDNIDFAAGLVCFCLAFCTTSIGAVETERFDAWSSFRPVLRCLYSDSVDRFIFRFPFSSFISRDPCRAGCTSSRAPS